MNITGNKIVYDVYWKLNAQVSSKGKDFKLVDVVRAINSSAEDIIQNLIHEEDQNRDIQNHLRNLYIKKHKVDLVKVDKDCFRFDYPENHYATSNIIAEACNKCCPGLQKTIPVLTLQSDDLQQARLNPYRKANFFFEQLIGDEAHDGFYIYHDCQMELKEVHIDYYRRFKGIQVPELDKCGDQTYSDWDGKLIVENRDFELCNTYIYNKVSDLAALKLAGASRDYNYFANKDQEIQILNNIHR